MKKVERLLLSFISMSMLSFGIGFVVNSQFGSDIFTLFMEASQKTWGLSIGTFNMIYGALLLIVTFVCDKNKIGIATLYYVVVGRFIIDWSIELVPIANNIYSRILYLLIATFLISFSVGLSIATRQGLSYYDAFLWSITDRFNIKYVVLKYVVEAILLLFSILLKTYPGIGTLVYFIVMGPAINFFTNLLKKPVRNHLDLHFDE